ncbi:MAG TPA: DUF2911 domain-containing protein [Sphingobacterium sp.]|nr:DUF2911 domain-containing protein [Sphingobacterium sp.]
MKKIIMTLLCSSILALSYGQVNVPQASTYSELKATIGLTEIEIQYSRPNKKDREIFGNVVPYGKIWRTGANANTTIVFSDDVIIDGQTLEAGKYAIFTKPEKGNWEIYFYSENDNWGNQVQWDEEKVRAKTTAEVQITPFITETFTISIDDIEMDKGEISFRWDDVYVAAEIEVPTDTKAMTSIEKTMQNGTPKAQDYISAANYFHQTGKDVNQAKEWIDEGIKMMENPPYYFLYSQALIHEKAGNKENALKIANASLEAAKEAADEAYIRQNQELIKGIEEGR